MKSTHFIVTLLVAFLIGGCQGVQPGPNGTPGKTSPVALSEELSDLSIYHLNSNWVNQDQQTIALQGLQGKPVLVSLVYTGCAFACPRTVADLQMIEKGLTAFDPEDFHILLVTIDPEHDTPAQLAKFADQNKLDPNRWSLVAADDAATQELAAVLNVKYRKTVAGEFAHSNLITVLNAQGEIVHQQKGLGASPEETVLVMKGLLAAN